MTPKLARRLLRLVADIDADGVDAGPLSLARYTEPLGMLLVQLAYVQGMGARIGATLLREAATDVPIEPALDWRNTGRRNPPAASVCSDGSSKVPETSELERNVQLVVDHFEDFVNRKDLGAIERNLTAAFHGPRWPRWPRGRSGGGPGDDGQDARVVSRPAG